MNMVFSIIASALLAPVIAVRLIFLIPGRLGWVNYLANVLSEFFVKKAGWSRGWVEFGMAVLGLTAMRQAGADAIVLGWTILLLLGLELYVSKAERQLLINSFTPIDPIGLRRATAANTRGLAQGYPTPSTHPELTLNLAGPFVSRMPAI